MPRLKPSPQVIEPVLTARQIAVVHGVQTRTVKTWCIKGWFAEWCERPDGSVEVPVAAYQKFVEGNRLSTRAS